ncbi:response regulator [Tumidithrix helvetica PCC 7403]|uniref:response regulator n=1 Tax=Tumidithrix helvetica TaxID=3457545 RepID=UPI003C94445B
MTNTNPSTILIVDDNPANLEVLYGALSNEGYSIRVEVDGVNAIDQIDLNAPDLILLDIMLPGIDGFEVCRRLKGNEKTKDIPVIFMSALTDTADKLTGLDLGAVDYITKPFQQEEVLARVRLHLQLRQLMQTLALQNQELNTLTEKLEDRVRERTLALQQSEEYFRQLAENIETAFWMTSVETNIEEDKIIYKSPAYEKIWGRSKDEVYQPSSNWLSTIHPDDRDRILAALPKQVSGGFDEVYRILRPDGEIRWIRDRAFPILNEQGEPYRIAGISDDITKSKEVEKLLAVQYKIATVLAESTSFNKAATKILQILCEQMTLDVGELWLTNAHPHVLRLMASYTTQETDVDELIQSHNQMSIEYGSGFIGTVWAEGIAKWVEIDRYPNFRNAEAVKNAGLNFVFCFPVPGENDAILAVISLLSRECQQPSAELLNVMLAVCRQIGQFIEKRRTEKQLQKQNWRMLLLSDLALRIRQSLDLTEILSTSVTEIRKFLNTDRVLIYRFYPDWNGTVEVESVGSKWISSLGVNIQDTCFQSGQWQAYQEGRKMAIDNVASSGLSDCHKQLLARFQVQANLVVPIIENEHLWGLLIAHQCSASRHWESFEINLLSQLADQIGIAISQSRLLAQEREQRELLQQKNNDLEIARKEAEAATVAKGSFLATMSHEIRTPMNAVIGMTGLLLDTTLNSQQQDFAQTIRSSGDHLLNLINEILDFSKLEAGEMQLEVLDFDIETSIEEVAEILATVAQTKGLELITFIHSDVPKCLQGDVSRLRQVLLNLVNNAIKFTSRGEVTIEVSLLSEDAITVALRFAVIDTGIGIPAKALSKLFQPFTQVDASTTRKYGGTGLGLAICKQIVELMGGEIHVESEENYGSTFWFELLFEKQSECPTNNFGVDILRGMRVLVVDDSTTNCRILNHQLSSWEMRVDTVEHSVEAIACLNRAVEIGDPYELALLDMQMPDLDGESLGKQIKDSPTLQNTHLIMLTSLDQNGAAKRMLEIGFDYYLRKPVRKLRLLNCVIDAITGIRRNSNLNQINQNLKKAEPIPPSKLKILLAEDSPVNQKVAINQLHNLGFHADVAANGKEVLELLAQIPYDIILMDCQMPILDGYETSRKIRDLEAEAQNKSAKIVIIALTANAMKEDRDRCLASGMDDYLSKPIRKEDLGIKLSYWSEVIAQIGGIASLNPNPYERSNSVIEEIDNIAQINPDENDLEIDWKYLDDMCSGNEAFKQELLKAFVGSLPEHLDALKAAIAESQYLEIEREAHFLKGTSAAIGIKGIAKLAAIFEDRSKQAQLPDNATLLFEKIILGVKKIEELI